MAKLWIGENVQRSNGYFFLSCLALIISLISSIAWAAEKPYPNRPINMVIAYAPGGSADLCSKPVADRMAEFLGQPMISVYKPGGGGSLGAAVVAKARPDGYTVLLGSSTPLAISPVVKKMDYVLEDFSLIGIFGKGPLWLAVKADARWKTLKDFVEEAKKSPGKLTVGSYGKLSASHFCIETFSKHAGITLTHIPFKSSGEALTAILGGHIDSALVKGASGHLESGSIRILAAATDKRLEWLSDVPTFKEFGYPVLANQWNSFCVPKATPKEVVDKLINAQKTAFEKYGKEIREDLKRVEYWVELYDPQVSMQKFKEERETALKIVEELGAAVK
jgi:tripartite-type tricarboxylate transporter receptor subunit TctC